MPSYRIYLLDEARRIAGPASDFDFGDDEAACAHARRLLDEHPAAQVWQGQRLVRCEQRD